MGLFGGGGGDTSSQDTQAPVAETGVNVQSSCYGLPVPIVIGTQRLAGNLLEFSGLVSYANYEFSGGGGGGKGGGGKGGGGGTWHITGYNYFANVAFGLSEGPIAGIGLYWFGQSVGNFVSAGYEFFPGTFPNPALWSGSQGPEAYSGLCYVGGTHTFLGTSAQIPNANWEVISYYAGKSLGFPLGSGPDAWGRLMKYIAANNVNFKDAYTAGIANGWLSAVAIPSNTYDADPAIATTVLLTDPYFGASYPAANLGGLTMVTESRTIPGTPFQLVANKSANYAFPVNVVGGAGIPSWFNLQGGTFLITYQNNWLVGNTAHSNILMTLQDGSGYEFCSIYGSDTGTTHPAAFIKAENQLNQPDLTGTTSALGSRHMIAFTFGQFQASAASLDGAAAVQASSAPNQMWLNNQLTTFMVGNGDFSPRGSIDRINYYPFPVTPAELARLSAGTDPRATVYNLNFLVITSIPSDWAFSRASSKTYTNSSGQIASVGSGVPVLGIAYWNGRKLGLTLDAPSINQCANSQTFNATGWANQSVSVSINSATAPDGTTTDNLITSSAANAAHYIRYSSSFSAAAGHWYGVSCFVKQGNQRYATVGDWNDSVFHGVTYDFTNNVVTEQFNCTAMPVETLANGWFRISLIMSATTTHNAGGFVSFGPNATPGGAQTYNAAGTETGRAWGMAIEDQSPSAYIPTSGATASRATEALNYIGGGLMTCVASNPAPGQYTLDQSTATYTFNSADAGAGVSLRYAALTGLAEMQQWCSAQGLYVSMLYDSQTAVNSMLDEICTSLHLAAVWTSGTLNLIPKGTANVTGNGFTWTAPSAPLFALTDDDFVVGQGGTSSQSGGSVNDPVLMTRGRPSDQINDIKLEWLDRANYYAPAIAEAKDQANIDDFGLRPPSSVQGHFFTNVNAANVSVQFQLQDQFIRNQYSFSLDERYCLLDPMDVVELTDGTNSAIQDQWVRITEITENDDGTFSMIAEEYPTGTGVSATYSFGSGTGYLPNANADPGPVNTPVVIAAPPQLATNQGLEIWIAVSGSNPTQWGGASVFVSSDDATYRYIGQMNTPTRMGVTTTTLNAGPDPDMVDVVQVNLSMSHGDLQSGTQADADAANTLCYISSSAGIEFISYQTATLIGTNAYELQTYLRRGQYQTKSLTHPSGATFVRLDESVFRIAYTPAQIGTTLYLKLTSFNLFGAGEEDISGVTAYPIVLPPPAPPPDVTNFSARQIGTAVAFAWDAVNYPLVALAGYYIGYAPEGTTDWTLFTMLTEAQGGSGTEMTNADVPPGTWTFGIRAANIANAPGTLNGLSPDITKADLTVTNATATISAIEQSPDWEGMSAGFAHDGFAALIPHGTKTVESYAALAPPAAPTLSSVASGLALNFTAFVKITYVTAFGETICSAESSIAITSGHAVKVTSPPAYGNATGYNVYVSTTTGTETNQNGLPIAIGTDWTQSIAVFTGAGQPALNTTGFEPYDDFVPDAVPFAYYNPPMIDVGLNEEVRLIFSSTEQVGPRQGGTAGTNFSYGADTWQTGGSDSGVFTPVTSVLTTTARYIKTQLLYNPTVAGQIQYVTQFLPTIGAVVSEVDSNNVPISSGGTVFSFGRTYAQAPYVVATPVSSTPLYATVTSITTTQCTIHVWNSSGTDVGGTVNIQVTGQ